MSDNVITVENLSKSYLIGHGEPREKYHSLRDAIVRHGKNYARKAIDMARGRQIIQGDSVEEFWALKDVSFEVKRGEVLGIIGRNGAGKSTLLKILSRITEPTTGRITLDGRVASLLEVGTGFHPELTGRENIFLNGAILGMPRADIKRKFDEIVDFAGVEKFLDTPVKRYSSGMYVRLAFAVAAHLEPEILIIDEVLAVGDAEFQKKCLGKMKDVAKCGRTVLFVSHNMAAISQFSTCGLLLERGKNILSGSISDVIQNYSISQERKKINTSIKMREGSGELRYTYANSEKNRYTPDEIKTFNFEIRALKNFPNKIYVSGLVKLEGEIIVQFDSRLVNTWHQIDNTALGSIKIVHPWMRPGIYTVDLYICSIEGIIDQFEDAIDFEVFPLFPYIGGCDDGALRYGTVLADFSAEFNVT